MGHMGIVSRPAGMLRRCGTAAKGRAAAGGINRYVLLLNAYAQLHMAAEAAKLVLGCAR